MKLPEEVTTEHVPEGMLFKGKKGGKSALFLFSSLSVKFPKSFKLLNFCVLSKTKGPTGRQLFPEALLCWVL